MSKNKRIYLTINIVSLRLNYISLYTFFTEMQSYMSFFISVVSVSCGLDFFNYGQRPRKER